VSVEAISWALNLAPVPRDGGGKPNPACKAVLIGLANHAGPDGKDTFPSEHTLVRYTCLSKRTVQTALDRLEDEDLAALERQFPGLTARVMSMRMPDAQVGAGADDGMQQLHPVAGTGCNSHEAPSRCS